MRHGHQWNHQSVDITSTPEGASALIDPGEIEVETPGQVELERKNTYSVQQEHEEPDDPWSIPLPPSTQLDPD